MESYPVPIGLRCMAAYLRSMADATSPKVPMSMEEYEDRCVIDSMLTCDGQPLKFIAIPCESVDIERLRATMSKLGIAWTPRDEEDSSHE